MVAEGKMNGRQRADGFDQLSEHRVIARQPGFKREVAIDDDRGGLHRPRGKFAHTGGEIVRHVDIAVFQRGIRRDMRVGEKGEGVLVPRFTEQPGVTFRRGEFHESQANASQRSAFQKFTTRELRQRDGHKFTAKFPQGRRSCRRRAGRRTSRENRFWPSRSGVRARASRCRRPGWRCSRSSRSRTAHRWQS